jgi:hypothetical protein
MHIKLIKSDSGGEDKKRERERKQALVHTEKKWDANFLYYLIICEDPEDMQLCIRGKAQTLLT